MKIKLLISVFLLAFGQSFSQDSLNMKKHYHWEDQSLYYNTYFGINQYYNEIWGWADTTNGREYAIMGAADGTYFFDVTNVDSCYMVDYIEASDRAEIHRDYKTFGDYVYMVADEGENSLQIYDMTTLPDSVTLAYDSSEFVLRSHNIYIEEGILYMVTPAIVGGGGPSGFRMLDLNADPINPTFIADYDLPTGQGSHVHDLYVRDSIAYCSNGTSGLFIYDVSDPDSIEYISSMETYSEQGYNHNSWMTDDGNTLFFTDETLGMGIKSMDISDLQNLQITKIFRSNAGAMAHNVLVKGDSLYVAYYHDGLVVFDITDPSNPVSVASYDTYEEVNGYYNYQGAWGVYPYLPSGNMLVSDFENGFFVLSFGENDRPIDGISGISENKIRVYPNPAKDVLNVSITEGMGSIKLLNTVGEVLQFKNISSQQSTLDISKVSPGIYFIEVISNEKVITKKFIKE